jgi:hypothetical protein
MRTPKNTVRLEPKKKVAIGVAKCPTTGRIYGVRIEERTDKKWIATWAFPIKPEVAKREGYSTNQFPPDLLYDKEYPGCPYCKKRENLAEITKQPAKKPNICVSSPTFDNIGQILDSLKISYSKFSDKQFDCDVLFLNCGTSDPINSQQLEAFVKKGGCLYASDFVADTIAATFPGVFNFAGHVGTVMTMAVDVVDRELQEIAGTKLSITFDLGGWVLLNSSKGEVLLRASAENSSQYAKKPIMVKAEYGKGLIFYTSFHNHAQASEREKALLQLLLLRQFGANSNTSITGASNALGVDINEIKSKFNFNW